MERGFRKKFKRLIRQTSSSRSSRLSSHPVDASQATLDVVTPQADAQSHDNKPASPLETVDESDMWMKADKELRKDENKRAELDYFDRVLEKHYGKTLAPIGTLQRREQMLGFTSSKLVELDDVKKREKFGVSSGRTRDLFDAAIKGIMKSKEVINAAAQPCLPASVACAGFMLLLSIYVQAVEERNVFYEGVKSLSWSVYRLAQYESLLWNRHGQPPDAEVEYLFVESCSNILYFQARTARYLGDGSFKKGLKDAFRVNAWDVLIANVAKAEQQIQECARRKDSQDLLAIFSHVIDMREASGQNRHADHLLQQLYAHAYPYRDRKNRNVEPVNGTCKWFASQEKFTNWESPPQGHGQDSSPCLLYVTADPGCGKSVLARHLVDTVLPRDGRAVCYTFFKDDFEDQKTSQSAVCALLHQLLTQCKHLIKEEGKVLDAFRSHGDKFFDSFTSVWDTFTAAAIHQETVCVLDALDECRDADRRELIAAISRTLIPTLKFLLTCRPYEHITREIRRENAYEISSIHIQGDQGPIAEEIVQEIQLVVEYRIDDTAKYWNLSAKERQLLQENIRKVPNRTYLWVTLVFDGLMKRKLGFEKKDIIALTTELPQGIDAAYEKLLSKSQHQSRTTKLLKFVLAAERPLSLAEMAIALAYDNQSSWSNLMDDVFPQERFREHVRNLCGLFINVVDERIYLLHQTAREFLLPKPHSSQKDTSVEPPGMGKPLSLWQHSISLTDSNEALATLCLQIIQLYPFERHLPEDDLLNDVSNQGMSIAVYAAQYWTKHYGQSSIEYRVAAVGPAETVMKCTQWRNYNLEERELEDESVLAMASIFGLDKLVEKLLHDQLAGTSSTEQTKSQNMYGETPLHRAARNGHTDTVKLLLTTGKASVDIADKYGQTPLHGAAYSGHTDTVKLLLTTGKASVDIADKGGQTPLYEAAFKGHTDTVKVLLTTGKASVDKTENGGWTPLDAAAFSGHTDTVKVLLTTGKAGVDKAYNEGRTPLYYAARNGTQG